jgi:hypothetical protein
MPGDQEPMATETLRKWDLARFILAPWPGCAPPVGYEGARYEDTSGAVFPLFE